MALAAQGRPHFRHMQFEDFFDVSSNSSHKFGKGNLVGRFDVFRAAAQFAPSSGTFENKGSPFAI